MIDEAVDGEPLRILMMHSRYQQRGGEDVSTHAEADLLRRGGHQVRLVEYDNSEVSEIGRSRAAIRTIWSQPAVNDLRVNLSSEKFDVLHVQNYLPLVSPAVLLVASRMGIATVQALRNYRLMCAAGNLFRDGHDCQVCVGRVAPWEGIRHSCYRDSLVGSTVLTGMVLAHKMLRTWHHHTDALITVSDFVRTLYVQGGFPEDRLVTKANIAFGVDASGERCRQAIFTGRLTPEKGVNTLIAAWKKLSHPNAKLVIVGTGPEEHNLKNLAGNDPSIHFAGHVDHQQMMGMVARSLVAVIPSMWAEPFGRTAVEALAVGTPVIASNRGGLSEIISKTGGGALYSPENVDELALLISKGIDDYGWWKIAHEASKAGYDRHFSPLAILRKTEEIYRHAIKRRRMIVSGLHTVNRVHKK